MKQLDTDTVKAIIEMISNKLSTLSQEQKDPEIAYSDSEYWAVKLEFKDFRKQLGLYIEEHINAGCDYCKKQNKACYCATA